jgi:hypothetical protein
MSRHEWLFKKLSEIKATTQAVALISFSASDCDNITLITLIINNLFSPTLYHIQ